MATAKLIGYVIEALNGKQVLNKSIRFSCYRLFMYEKFGHLGHGSRMKLPCVEKAVKEQCPEIDGNSW
jgi:hypothetical protein